MNSQCKRKFDGSYSQRVLTPEQQQSYDAISDIDLREFGIDHDRQQGRQQGRPPRPPSRSEWAPIALRPSSVLTGSLEPGALTGGPNPIYYTGRSAAPYTGEDGKIYPGEDNIFPPNRQADLPLRFAPNREADLPLRFDQTVEPVGLNQIDTTPQHIQDAALDAFRTTKPQNPYPYSPPSFAPISPVYPSPPERYAAADAANQSVVSSIGNWLGSMGKGGKTRKKKRMIKRKTIRKMKSKKSKKSRRR